MKSAKMSTILVLGLGLMVLPASVASGAQSLTVNGQPVASITLELGQSCTVEVVSDDSRSYIDYAGFDNGAVLGTFSHLETTASAGDQANVTVYKTPTFYGYHVVAEGIMRRPGPGVHFIFEYEAQEVGETDVKLYDSTLTSLIDSVHITVVPAPMGTAITYQGRLMDSNSPADGLYDFKFKLYRAPNGGIQEGNTIDINDLDVIDGQFAVELDFGSGIFTGDARWLQVGVRAGDSNDPNAFVTLSPRMELKPTPYALYAKTAETAGDDGDWRISGNNMYAIPSGTVTVSGTVLVLRSLDATGPGLEVSRSAAWPNIGKTWMEIDDVSIDTYSRIAQTDGTTLKLNSNSSGNVILAEGGGNVGIGTTEPAEKLEVAGNEKVTGDLKVGGSYFDSSSDAGAAGQILASTGAGTDWVNQASIYDGDWTISGNDMYSAVSGNVGIGAASLYAKLHVEESGTGYAGNFEQTGASNITGGMNVTTAAGQYGAKILNQGGYSGSGYSHGLHVSTEKDTGSSALYGIYSYGKHSGTNGESYGMKSKVYGSDTGDSYGIYSEGNKSGTDTDGTAYGGYFFGYDCRIGGTSYGVYGKAIGFDSEQTSYGVYGEAMSWEGTNYGVYGYAAYGTTNYAGYFDGDVGVRNGRLITPVLEITGGSDLSEQFEVSDEGGKVKPGMVVCIDAENPGNLVVSKKTYDRTVAGIVSGAGGVKPGMLMGQKGTEADGEHPVAMTGRVYCWADASNGPIEPGDLLTTSDMAGHAMKVTDYTEAQGAILGKAMSSLEQGKGLVLVLVTLQ